MLNSPEDQQENLSIARYVLYEAQIRMNIPPANTDRKLRRNTVMASLRDDIWGYNQQDDDDDSYDPDRDAHKFSDPELDLYDGEE